MPIGGSPIATRLKRLAAALAVAAIGVSWGAVSEEPLEPERAFPLSARVVKKAGSGPILELRFGIEPGYYLYRDRFKIVTHLPAAGPVALPAGLAKDDPFVGRARILKREATLRLPLKIDAPAGIHVVTVTAQGCAEDRVCYAPFVQSVQVNVP